MNMDVHVARQPIFDAKLNVFAYELLFRQKVADAYDGKDGDKDTNCVIVNSFLLMGIQCLTNGKRAFINFTGNAIKGNIPRRLSKDLIAVEILEDVVPDGEIIKACRELKKRDYMLVLDDFVCLERFSAIIPLIDMVKIDFRLVQAGKRKELVRTLEEYPVKFLAEKVETYEEFAEAVKMGFSYFQGYFFCKPQLRSHRDIVEYKENHLQILQEIHQPEMRFSRIEKIVKRDVVLSYKLLKFINSSIFGLRSRIYSLRQAMLLLGEKELKNWILLLALKDIVHDKPREILVESLIRAKFCETMAADKMSPRAVENAFLIGIFSYLDVLLDRPMREVLDEIHLSKEIKAVLLGEENNQLASLYRLAVSYEKADWKSYTKFAAEMNLEDNAVSQAYRKAVKWAGDIA